jgi:hypothetical protein
VQRSRDHQGVFEAHTLEDVTAVRTEGHGENLVRGLGRDESHGTIRGRVGRSGRDKQERDGEYEEAEHVTPTAWPNQEVP